MPELTLETALQGWRHWRPALQMPPQLLCELEPGDTNLSYLLETQAGRAVLRLDSPQQRQLGIDREREALILRVLDGHGFAPDVWYQRPQQGLLVSAFIAGEVCSSARLAEAQRQPLLRIIQQYQSIELALPRMNYYRHLLDYWDQASALGCLQPGWPAHWRQFVPRLKAFQESDWRPVLCHHDLQGDNVILSATGMRLIDWEYAAYGHPAFDAVSAGLAGIAAVPLEQQRLLQEVIGWLNQLWWAIRHAGAAPSGTT